MIKLFIVIDFITRLYNYSNNYLYTILLFIKMIKVSVNKIL